MDAFKKAIVALSALAVLATGAPTPGRPEADLIEGSYIIKLKDEGSDVKSHTSWVEDIQSRNVKRDGDGVKFAIDFDGFHGYTGHFDEATVSEIENSPEVAYIEKDQIWSVYDHPVTKRALTTQSNAVYGLASISNRSPGYTDYTYDESAGESTYAYVVDTGLLTSHQDFQGRATKGYSVFPDNNNDNDGHGTHVAGTIAGATYGVAKKANVIGVKVFRGRDGTTADVIKGYEWAINDIVSKGRQNSAVINMSLGGGYSQVFNDLVAAASAKGVVTVVAAGNDIEDASYYSPASAPSAITVGAINPDWGFGRGWYVNGVEYGSNWGPALDIFAPGGYVESCGIRSNSDVVELSGTSMAAPHVAGLALFAMSVDGVKGPKAVRDHLVENSTKNKITGNLFGSANRMANNGRP